MGAKDTKAKEYLSDNERFADLCNAVLFDGEQVVRAEDLEEKDTAEVLSVFGTDKKEVQLQRWRDLLKSVVVKSIGSAYVVLIGVENQSDIHYAMPVKNMLYDAMNYSAQVNNIGKHHKKAGDSGSQAEFLSGFYRDDRLMPVVTITVYWGSKEWDGPRCLHDMISSTDERLKKFVSDYHINLVVPQEITDFDKFRTTLGEVLEIIKVSEDKAAMKQLLATNPQFAAMDNESVSAINTFIGVNIPVNTEGSVTDMCKAWEDQREEDRNAGRAEGRTEGRLFEVYSSVQDGDYGIKRGAEKLGITEEEFEKRMLEAGFQIPVSCD